jgi:hypothetical protein
MGMCITHLVNADILDYFTQPSSDSLEMDISPSSNVSEYPRLI